MTRQVASRVGLISAAFVAAGSAYWLDPKATNDALGGLITYFSISAGVLVAALTLVGNATSLLPKGEWKVLQVYQDTFEHKITRLTVLIYVQLAAVGLLCLGLFLPEGSMTRSLAVTLSAFAFVLSLGAPVIIAGMYREYYQFVIDYGRQDSRRRVKVSGTLEVGRGKDEQA